MLDLGVRSVTNCRRRVHSAPQPRHLATAEPAGPGMTQPWWRCGTPRMTPSRDRPPSLPGPRILRIRTRAAALRGIDCTTSVGEACPSGPPRRQHVVDRIDGTMAAVGGPMSRVSAPSRADRILRRNRATSLRVRRQEIASWRSRLGAHIVAERLKNSMTRRGTPLEGERTPPGAHAACCGAGDNQSRSQHHHVEAPRSARVGDGGDDGAGARMTTSVLETADQQGGE